MASISIGNHLRHRTPVACGTGCPTLLIASVGSSSPKDALGEEVQKAQRAAQLGAGAVTDHSFYGDIQAYHQALVDEVDTLISTVTCYEFAAGLTPADWAATSAERTIEVLQGQLERGIDLVTIHATYLREDLIHLDESTRLIPTTSKGGGIVARIMRETGGENPYYLFFDDILELFRECGATISLGTTFRPASVCDSWDDSLYNETKRMGELVARARAVGVNIMIEGFGHAPLNEIPTLINLASQYCPGVPYRILPMATDRALGFDHISGAISTAVAVMHGASAVTAMSRAEHISLPTLQDLEEAIVATKVAIASGELGRGRNTDAERQMARTRWVNGCKGDWTVAIDQEGAEEALRSRGRLEDQRVQCGMCEDFCGIAAGNTSVRLGPKQAGS